MVSKTSLPEQRLLVIDIEWRPTLAYVWKAWDENINPEQIVEHGGLLCVGAKYVGDKETHLFSEWDHGHEGMLLKINEMMNYADAFITYNGDRFDLRKLDGEFCQYDLPPVPPCTSIDLIKAIKKFSLFRSSLSFASELMAVGSKMEHEGFGLWKKVMAGDKDAQKRMAQYCQQDVNLTEELYLRIRPYIRQHPHMGRTGHEECPVCGGKHSHSRGTRRTRVYKVQRLQCQDCGHWYDGKRQKI